ncbi:DUF1048 domain-containing protein [Desulfotomaculum defluvii]
MNSEIQKFIQNNFELSKKLTPENDMIFTDIVCYLRTSSMGALHTEEAIQQILDMFISAQQRGESINQVIGSDYKLFCDSIIENSPKEKLWASFFTFIELFLFSMIFMCSINLLFDILPVMIENKQIILEYNLTLGLVFKIVTVLAIAYAIVGFIGKNSFKLTNNSKAYRFLVGALLGLFIFLPGFLSYKMNNYVLFTTQFHYVAIVLIPSYLIVRFFNKRR